MSEQYLILHKVRGEPAFDIAEQIQIGDELGWIIPTSGHRAYPYKQWDLDELGVGQPSLRAVPDGWPDHYNVTKEGPKVQVNFGQILSGLTKFKFKRRF